MARIEPNIGDFINVLTRINAISPEVRVDAIVVHKGSRDNNTMLYYLYKKPNSEDENITDVDIISASSPNFFIYNKPGTPRLDRNVILELSNEAEKDVMFPLPRVQGGKKRRSRRNNTKSKRRRNRKTKRRR